MSSFQVLLPRSAAPAGYRGGVQSLRRTRAHHRLEGRHGLARVTGVEGNLVVERAEFRSAVEVRASPILLARVFIDLQVVPVKVYLEHRVVLEHPAVRLRHERPQDRGHHLAVVERPEGLAEVVEYGTHHILLVAPVAQGARGRLQAVLEAVDRIRRVRLEIRHEPDEQIGQFPNVLLVHPGEHREIRIGPLVHPPEVHLANIIRHTVLLRSVND